MVQTLVLRATQDGVIWPRRPLISSKGLISCVQNLPLSSHDKRPTPFRAVAFNASGELLAATDERGRIFVFFVTANRYSLVQHLGLSTISCCFSPTRKTELLVTCEDETVRCIDVQSQLLISTLKGHRFPAKRASYQKSGQLALTASQDAVILWDTKDWSRYRVLNAGPGVEEALFVSKGELVAVCFQDDTIMMWELESLALKYRFLLPEDEQSPGLRRIAVSDDHQVLVASGRAPCIYVWAFESQTIIRIIELPAPITQVVSHAFLPGHNTLVSILADDGGIFFLDVAAKNPQIKLEISNRGQTIAAFDIECHGRYLAAITSDGFLLLYDMAITRETAARAHERRRQEGLVELGEHAQLRTRSGLQEHSRPVLSKLIDSLFGVQHPRRSASATTAGQAQMTRDQPGARVQTTERPLHVPLKKTHEGKYSKAGDKMGTRHLNPLTRPSAQLTAKEIEVNRKRLVGSLKVNGMFPKKYRVLVWRFLLRLPKNEEAFRSLVAKGKHPIFVRLKEHYPLQNSRLFRRLHRILSAIVYWCPAFGEVSYLPAVVYPFVKIFRENDLAAFEASVSVLLHWCGDFLINLPNPPVFAIKAIEKELARRDGQLFDHFTRYQITSEVFAWSLLKTLFTEVLSEDEWMCLWDHLFAYSDTPQLLYLAVLAYLSYYRTALLAACDRFSIEQFFHQQNAINIQKFVQLVINLRERLDLSDFTAIEDVAATDRTTSGHGPFWPLARGQYPAFAHYPRFVVDYQISERNRIALEEAELAHKQDVLAQIKSESEKLKTKHESWIKERKMILDAEERRRKEAIAAEKERILHLKTLDFETRKRRLEHLSILETSATETLEEATKMLQTEYQRLESTLAMQKERAEFEISSREQEEALLRVELETYDRVKDIHKRREMEERLAQLQAEYENRAKQQELHYLFRVKSWKRESEEELEQAKIELRRREEATLVSQEKRLREELDKKLLEQQLVKDKALLKLEAARRARRQKQQHHDDDDKGSSLRANDRMSMRECARGTSKTSQKEEEESSPRHSSKILPFEVTVDEQRDCGSAGRSSDGDSESDRDASLRRRDVPPSDGRSTRRNESFCRTPDDALSDVATQLPLQNSSSRESSMSFSSASMRRTRAEMSLLEKALGNVSSSMSSDQSGNRIIEGHADNDFASVETRSAECGRPRQDEENSRTRGEGLRQGLQQSSHLKASTSLQALNESIHSPIVKPHNPEGSVHDEVIRMPQAAQKALRPTINDEFASVLMPPTREESRKSEKAKLESGLSQERGNFTFTRPSFSPAQSKREVTPLQATRKNTMAKDEDLSTPQGAIRSYSQDQEFARKPLSPAESLVFIRDERAIPSSAGLHEVSDSDSEEYAPSPIMDALQRPIAELEKKLGIRFDDFSDEEKESVDVSLGTRFESDEEDEEESIEDDCEHLLQRAKRLLELSNFDVE